MNLFWEKDESKFISDVTWKIFTPAASSETVAPPMTDRKHWTWKALPHERKQLLIIKFLNCISN